jgi:sulfur carrier protein ThiS
MNLQINNTNISLKSTLTSVDELVLWMKEHPEDFPFTLPSSYAITINKRFIPRSQYADSPLQENDHLHFIFPQPGG